VTEPRTCAFCGETVDVDDDDVYRKFSEWVSPPDGTNGRPAETLREDLDEWAHESCLVAAVDLAE
jgi:hypothetical protein